MVDKDGQLITKNGREGVTVRPSEFPWTPKTMAQELAGSLLAANGAVIPDAIAHFKGKKVRNSCWLFLLLQELKFVLGCFVFQVCG